MKRTMFLAGLAMSAYATSVAGSAVEPRRKYPVTHSDAEWRKLLGPDRYAILREGETEPADSSPLIAERRAGIYLCAGCGNSLFTSNMKYDSGDGWPSFWNVLPGAVRTKADYELIEPRTEVHCSRCGGHLGHRFHDGPAPTYLRYCIDGLALTFVPTRKLTREKAR